MFALSPSHFPPTDGGRHGGRGRPPPPPPSRGRGPRPPAPPPNGGRIRSAPFGGSFGSPNDSVAGGNYNLRGAGPSHAMGPRRDDAGPRNGRADFPHAGPRVSAGGCNGPRHPNNSYGAGPSNAHRCNGIMMGPGNIRADFSQPDMGPRGGGNGPMPMHPIDGPMHPGGNGLVNSRNNFGPGPVPPLPAFAPADGWNAGGNRQRPAGGGWNSPQRQRQQLHPCRDHPPGRPFHPNPAPRGPPPRSDAPRNNNMPGKNNRSDVGSNHFGTRHSVPPRPPPPLPEEFSQRAAKGARRHDRAGGIPGQRGSSVRRDPPAPPKKPRASIPRAPDNPKKATEPRASTPGAPDEPRSLTSRGGPTAAGGAEEAERSGPRRERRKENCENGGDDDGSGSLEKRVGAACAQLINEGEEMDISDDDEEAGDNNLDGIEENTAGAMCALFNLQNRWSASGAEKVKKATMTKDEKKSERSSLQREGAKESSNYGGDSGSGSSRELVEAPVEGKGNDALFDEECAQLIKEQKSYCDDLLRICSDDASSSSEEKSNGRIEEFGQVSNPSDLSSLAPEPRGRTDSILKFLGEDEEEMDISDEDEDGEIKETGRSRPPPPCYNSSHNNMPRNSANTSTYLGNEQQERHHHRPAVAVPLPPPPLPEDFSKVARAARRDDHRGGKSASASASVVSRDVSIGDIPRKRGASARDPPATPKKLRVSTPPQCLEKLKGSTSSEGSASSVIGKGEEEEIVKDGKKSYRERGKANGNNGEDNGSGKSEKPVAIRAGGEGSRVSISVEEAPLTKKEQKSDCEDLLQIGGNHPPSSKEHKSDDGKKEPVLVSNPNSFSELEAKAKLARAKPPGHVIDLTGAASESGTPAASLASLGDVGTNPGARHDVVPESPRSEGDKRALQLAELKAKAKLARARLRIAEMKNAGNRSSKSTQASGRIASTVHRPISTSPVSMRIRNITVGSLVIEDVALTGPSDEVRFVESVYGLTSCDDPLIPYRSPVQDAQPVAELSSTQENRKKLESLKQQLLKLEMKKKELQKRKALSSAAAKGSIESKREPPTQQLREQNEEGKGTYITTQKELVSSMLDEVSVAKSQDGTNATLEHLRGCQKELRLEKGVSSESLTQPQSCADGIASKQTILGQSERWRGCTSGSASWRKWCFAARNNCSIVAGCSATSGEEKSLKDEQNEAKVQTTRQAS